MMRNNPEMFHFVVWLASNSVTDFKITQPIPTDDNLSVTILFGKREDRDDFVKWYEKYRTVFSGDEGYLQVPSIPSKGTHTLTFVFDEDSASTLKFDDTLHIKYLNNWIWIVLNCSEAAYSTCNGFAFKSSDDAALFMLTNSS